MKDITASMWLEEIGPHRSNVNIQMEYTPKWGIFGKILNALVLRFVLQSTFKKVLTGLQTHLETGKLIGKNGKPSLHLSQAATT